MSACAKGYCRSQPACTEGTCRRADLHSDQRKRAPYWGPPCRMIGDNAAAERHVELKGHRVEQLDQETSDAVRDEWEKQEIAMFDPAIAAHMLKARDVEEAGSRSSNPGGPFGV
jgi:hypothetical protein